MYKHGIWVLITIYFLSDLPRDAEADPGVSVSRHVRVWPRRELGRGRGGGRDQGRGRGRAGGRGRLLQAQEDEREDEVKTQTQESKEEWSDARVLEETDSVDS